MMDLHQAARLYLGTPFRHQGRSIRFLDCIGLLVRSCADCGHPVQDVKSYGREPFGGLLEKHMTMEFGPPIPKSDMRPGDKVAIDFKGVVRHVGIIGDYIHGGLSLIHTDMYVGRVVEHSIDAAWLNIIKGVWR